MWYLSHVPQTGIIGPLAQRWVRLYLSFPIYLFMLHLDIFTVRVQGKASIATAISMNVLTTSLIASRVWWQKRTIQKAFGARESYLCIAISICVFDE